MERKFTALRIIYPNLAYNMAQSILCNTWKCSSLNQVTNKTGTLVCQQTICFKVYLSSTFKTFYSLEHDLKSKPTIKYFILDII